MKKKYKLLLIITSLFAIIFATKTFVKSPFFIYNDYFLNKAISPSSVPLEVVYVCAPKDFETLPYSVASVRKYLKQPINKVVLIAPKSEEAMQIAKSLDMEYINEDELLKHHDLMSWIKENKLSKNYEGSWNWYYQQFLKLLYYKISATQYYYVIDADVVIKRPLILVSNQNVRTFFTIEKNPLYISSAISTKTLLDSDVHIPPYSFITDSMCFDKNIVKTMLEKIEKKFNTDFYKAAILIEQNSKARFSEYEIYGTYANYSPDVSTFKTPPSYIPITSIDHRRKRDNLKNDNSLHSLKKHPYIAYHAWLNN